MRLRPRLPALFSPCQMRLIHGEAYIREQVQTLGGIWDGDDKDESRIHRAIYGLLRDLKDKRVDVPADPRALRY